MLAATPLFGTASGSLGGTSISTPKAYPKGLIFPNPAYSPSAKPPSPASKPTLHWSGYPPLQIQSSRKIRHGWLARPSAVHLAFAECNAAYKTLTSGQHTIWDAAAEYYAYLYDYGEGIGLNGRALYIYVNLDRRLYPPALPFVNTPAIQFGAYPWLRSITTSITFTPPDTLSILISGTCISLNSSALTGPHAFLAITYPSPPPYTHRPRSYPLKQNISFIDPHFGPLTLHFTIHAAPLHLPPFRCYARLGLQDGGLGWYLPINFYLDIP